MLHVGEEHLVEVGAARHLLDRAAPPRPGAANGTRNAVRPWCFGTSKSVRVMARPQSAKRAPDVHTFWPFRTHSSPSRTARVVSEARSEPAEGSLNSWQPSSSMRISGSMNRRFCSGVPHAAIVGAMRPIDVGGSSPALGVSNLVSSVL